MRYREFVRWGGGIITRMSLRLCIHSCTQVALVTSAASAPPGSWRQAVAIKCIVVYPSRVKWSVHSRALHQALIQDSRMQTFLLETSTMTHNFCQNLLAVKSALKSNVSPRFPSMPTSPPPPFPSFLVSLHFPRHPNVQRLSYFSFSNCSKHVAMTFPISG